jgi:restriction system protein
MSERVMWGIHMGHAHELRPVKDGYVAIGWKAMGDLSKISPNREAFKAAVAATYPNGKPGAQSRCMPERFSHFRMICRSAT